MQARNSVNEGGDVSIKDEADDEECNENDSEDEVDDDFFDFDEMEDMIVVDEVDELVGSGDENEKKVTVKLEEVDKEEKSSKRKSSTSSESASRKNAKLSEDATDSSSVVPKSLSSADSKRKSSSFSESSSKANEKCSEDVRDENTVLPKCLFSADSERKISSEPLSKANEKCSEDVTDKNTVVPKCLPSADSTRKSSISSESSTKTNEKCSKDVEDKSTVVPKSPVDSKRKSSISSESSTKTNETCSEDLGGSNAVASKCRSPDSKQESLVSSESSKTTNEKCSADSKGSSTAVVPKSPSPAVSKRKSSVPTESSTKANEKCSKDVDDKNTVVPKCPSTDSKRKSSISSESSTKTNEKCSEGLGGSNAVVSKYPSTDSKQKSSVSSETSKKTNEKCSVDSKGSSTAIVPKSPSSAVSKRKSSLPSESSMKSKDAENSSTVMPNCLSTADSKRESSASSESASKTNETCSKEFAERSSSTAKCLSPADSKQAKSATLESSSTKTEPRCEEVENKDTSAATSLTAADSNASKINEMTPQRPATSNKPSLNLFPTVSLYRIPISAYASGRILLKDDVPVSLLTSNEATLHKKNEKSDFVEKEKKTEEKKAEKDPTDAKNETDSREATNKSEEKKVEDSRRRGSNDSGSKSGLQKKRKKSVAFVGMENTTPERDKKIEEFGDSAKKEMLKNFKIPLIKKENRSEEENNESCFQDEPLMSEDWSDMKGDKNLYTTNRREYGSPSKNSVDPWDSRNRTVSTYDLSMSEARLFKKKKRNMQAQGWINERHPKAPSSIPVWENDCDDWETDPRNSINQRRAEARKDVKNKEKTIPSSRKDSEFMGKKIDDLRDHKTEEKKASDVKAKNAYESKETDVFPWTKKRWEIPKTIKNDLVDHKIDDEKNASRAGQDSSKQKGSGATDLSTNESTSEDGVQNAAVTTPKSSASSTRKRKSRFEPLSDESIPNDVEATKNKDMLEVSKIGGNRSDVQDGVVPSNKNSEENNQNAKDAGTNESTKSDMFAWTKKRQEASKTLENSVKDSKIDDEKNSSSVAPDRSEQKSNDVTDSGTNKSISNDKVQNAAVTTPNSSASPSRKRSSPLEAASDESMPSEKKTKCEGVETAEKKVDQPLDPLMAEFYEAISQAEDSSKYVEQKEATSNESKTQTNSTEKINTTNFRGEGMTAENVFVPLEAGGDRRLGQLVTEGNSRPNDSATGKTHRPDEPAVAGNRQLNDPITGKNLRPDNSTFAGNSRPNVLVAGTHPPGDLTIADSNRPNQSVTGINSHPAKPMTGIDHRSEDLTKYKNSSPENTDSRYQYSKDRNMNPDKDAFGRNISLKDQRVIDRTLQDNLQKALPLGDKKVIEGNETSSRSIRNKSSCSNERKNDNLCNDRKRRGRDQNRDHYERDGSRRSFNERDSRDLRSKHVVNKSNHDANNQMDNSMNGNPQKLSPQLTRDQKSVERKENENLQNVPPLTTKDGVVSENKEMGSSDSTSGKIENQKDVRTIGAIGGNQRDLGALNAIGENQENVKAIDTIGGFAIASSVKPVSLGSSFMGLSSLRPLSLGSSLVGSSILENHSEGTKNESTSNTENKDVIDLTNEEVCKALPLLEEYRKAVRYDPTDFTAWTHLLRHVDQGNHVPAACEIYNEFLSKYPYCYGYWRKYADYLKKHNKMAECEQVFEKGVQATPLSVDLWIHFLDYTREAYPKDENRLRELFERSLKVCGLEFRSDNLWDTYIRWETNKGNLQNVTKIMDRWLRVPTRAYSTIMEKFREHVEKNSPREILSMEEFLHLRLRIDAKRRSTGADLTPAEIKQMKEKIIDARKVQHKKTQKAAQDRWKFEENIKRPYFHIKPLEDYQLKNWRQYLDFEIKEGDYERIIVLFERCLIACASYDEFWMKFTDYLLSIPEKDIEKVRSVFVRACTIHHPKKLKVHLKWAQFEQMHGDPLKVPPILERMEQLCPNVLMLMIRQIKLLHLRGEFELVCSLYEQYMETINDKKDVVSNISMKYANFCNQVWDSIQSAYSVLQEAVKLDKTQFLGLSLSSNLQYRWFYVCNLGHFHAVYRSIQAKYWNERRGYEAGEFVITDDQPGGPRISQYATKEMKCVKVEDDSCDINQCLIMSTNQNYDVLLPESGTMSIESSSSTNPVMISELMDGPQPVPHPSQTQALAEKEAPPAKAQILHQLSLWKAQNIVRPDDSMKRGTNRTMNSVSSLSVPPPNLPPGSYDENNRPPNLGPNSFNSVQNDVAPMMAAVELVRPQHNPSFNRVPVGTPMMAVVEPVRPHNPEPSPFGSVLNVGGPMMTVMEPCRPHNPNSLGRVDVEAPMVAPMTSIRPYNSGFGSFNTVSNVRAQMMAPVESTQPHSIPQPFNQVHVGAPMMEPVGLHNPVSNTGAPFPRQDAPNLCRPGHSSASQNNWDSDYGVVTDWRPLHPMFTSVPTEIYDRSSKWCKRLCFFERVVPEIRITLNRIENVPAILDIAVDNSLIPREFYEKHKASFLTYQIPYTSETPNRTRVSWRKNQVCTHREHIKGQLFYSPQYQDDPNVMYWNRFFVVNELPNTDHVILGWDTICDRHPRYSDTLNSILLDDCHNYQHIICVHRWHRVTDLIVIPDEGQPTISPSVRLKFFKLDYDSNNREIYKSKQVEITKGRPMRDNPRKLHTNDIELQGMLKENFEKARRTAHLKH